MCHFIPALFRALIALTVITTFGATAAATPALAQSQGISLHDAERIALQLFPGATVESVERDVKRGISVYEVELRDERGVEHEVILDARDGRVIRTQVDD